MDHVHCPSGHACQTCSMVFSHDVSLAGEEQDIVCIYNDDNVLCW